MIRTIAVAAAISAAAAPAFAQQIDCSIPANAELNQCLALPTMSSQQIGETFTIDGTVWTVIAITAAFIVLSRDNNGQAVTQTIAR